MLHRRHLLSLLATPGTSLLHAAREPEMKWADSSRLGRPFSKDPSVIRFGGRYLLYCSLPGNADNNIGWAIGIAESRDLINWKKVAEILPEPGHAHEKNGICAPGAVVIGGRVHLFYQTYGNARLDAICHAESSDGIRFTRDASNPVFRPTGNWNAGRAIDADVIHFNDRWFLYVATRDPEMKIQMITGAVAEKGTGFGRNAWKMLADRPLLKPELPCWCARARCTCSTPVATTTHRSRLDARAVRTASSGRDCSTNLSCQTARRASGILRSQATPESSSIVTARRICSSRATTIKAAPGICRM